MVTKNKTVLRLSAARPENGLGVSIFSENEIHACDYKITDRTGKLLLNGCERKSVFAVNFNGDLWSVENPVMYDFEITVKFADGSEETITDSFGFRFFDCDEKNLYLNGYPFFMRAYIRGCAAHEHQNNCNLPEYEFYKKNILMAKSYGFNTIRFHSVIPPEECFRAADDNGILIHVEMRAEQTEYDNWHEMIYGKEDFISNEELIEIINNLYNHPSFAVYCVGNEIREPGKRPRIREIRDFIKKEDPNRLFIDTCAHGEYDRDYVDFDVQHMGYFFPYGKHKDMFENTDNLLCFGTVNNREMVAENENAKIRRGIAFKRPLIAHEVCHYTSWRDYYALKEKFEKYNHCAPWWVNEEIKMLEAKGYDKNFADTLQITKDYQFRCWKVGLEAIRSSKLLSGFHMLQFADTDKYENSNGVVDCFDDPQGIDAEAFSKFNADTVVLARLPKQIYAYGETVQIPVLLSQYKINPPASGKFSYKLTDSVNEIYSEATLTQVDTAQSGLYKICSIEFTLPNSNKPKKLTLLCELEFCDGSKCDNSWELWIFPECKEMSLDAQCRMEDGYLMRICRFNEKSSLIIKDRLDDELFSLLDDGADVMLIYRNKWTRHLLDKNMAAPKYAFRAVWERFKGVIWDRGTINGGYDESEILNCYGYVTDGDINFQYYPIVEDCDKINIEDFPVKVESIISGLDKSCRDRFDPQIFKLPELMYDRTMRRFSYAFVLKVGKGRLLVTGLNFTGVDECNPSACAMLNTLVNYCHSKDFVPKAQMTADELKKYLSDIAAEGPQKERMMTQYWQLDQEPVESLDYWTEAERYLRE